MFLYVVANALVTSGFDTLLAGDQWWPRTSGGRLRFIRAITYLLRHIIGMFVKGNKGNLHKKIPDKFSVRQKVDSFPSHPHANIAAFPGDYSPPDIYN